MKKEQATFFFCLVLESVITEFAKYTDRQNFFMMIKRFLNMPDWSFIKVVSPIANFLITNLRLFIF